jgi:hypothetical protein
MRLRLSVLLVLGGALVAASVAVSAYGRTDSAFTDVKLSQTVVSVGDPLQVNVNVHARFASVDSVCYTFIFENDLLDPGDSLSITPLKAFPPESGGGFFNPGPTSQDFREICDTAEFQPEIVSLFTDGKENKIEIAMQSGSVEIALLRVTITGVFS